MFSRSLKRCMTSVAVLSKTRLSALPKYEDHSSGFSTDSVKDLAKWRMRIIAMRDNLIVNAGCPECPKCQGTGYVKCPVCDNGCDYCEGTGIKKCKSCNGTGRML